MSTESCSACSADLAPDAGYRLSEPQVDRHAAFCRLEHLVAWAEDRPRWLRGTGLDEDDAGEGIGRCRHCGGTLAVHRLLLVRHRGPLRVADAFCDAEHLLAWARAGGRWRVG